LPREELDMQWTSPVRTLLLALFAASSSLACSSSNHETVPPGSDAGDKSDDAAKEALAAGDFQRALDLCSNEAPSCDASWCTLLASTSLFLQNDVNTFLLPRFKKLDLTPSKSEVAKLLQINEDMYALSTQVGEVVSKDCHYSLDHLPVVFGEKGGPLLDADARGEWTPRSALWLGATVDSMRYVFAAEAGIAAVPDADGGTPGLPALLLTLKADLKAHEAALLGPDAQQADPSIPRGGWLDADKNGKPSAADRLYVDLFVPNSDKRVFDFSDAEFVAGEELPRGGLPMPKTPKACGYQVWHVDTLIESNEVGTMDGMTFSPDGTQIAFPRIDATGVSQVQIANLDASSPRCLTCGIKSWNDGVRWRPQDPNTLIFVSNVDHSTAVGGDGGGAGQELYAIRADGTGATRLTHSDDWATNYHINWSFDGKRIVWGTTENRTWDVMVADFVDDAKGMRLANKKRITHDTTWWETHGFTPDGGTIITTNTRAGLLSPDLYAIDLKTNARTRLTDDPTWDEHGHVSPDGTQLSWIAGRWHPGSIVDLAGGQFAPVGDYWWIIPGIVFCFVNPPAGYSTELTLMNVDGSNVRQLTTEGEVVADNQWSPDGKKIIFRQAPAPPKASHPPRLRMLTFDDCP
jgi:Tol biopolymer transport system component